jgi:streptogramin lyase
MLPRRSSHGLSALRRLAPAAAVVALLAGPARAADYERFPLGGLSLPANLLRGPDGALWFTGDPGVGRLGPDGKLRVFARGLRPDGLAVGPDGNLWVTDGVGYHAGRALIARLTPGGVLTRFTTGIPADAQLGPITTGPDGALWFAELIAQSDGSSATRIARITTAGVVMQSTDVRAPDEDRRLVALSAGPDGSLWFFNGFHAGHLLLPSGTVRWLERAGGEALDGSLTVGPEGDVWAVGLDFSALWRIAPATETITTVPAPEGVDHILFDPDGTLWAAGFLGLTRIAPDGAVLERLHDPFGDSDGCDGSPVFPDGGLAMDAADQVWAADGLGDSLILLTAAPGAGPGPLQAVLPNRGSFKQPQAVATARDGTLWVATARALIRVRPGGPPRVVRRVRAQDIAVARDGSVWFTRPRGGFGHLDVRGHLRRYALGRRDVLGGITTDARGEPWFVEAGRHRIGHRTRSGRLRHFARGIPRRSDLLDITAGPDGAMWFTDQTGRIGRITRSGRVRMFRSGAARRRNPTAITRGPDGALWFTDFRGRVSRISVHGRVREFKVAEAPTAITSGADGALWFSTTQSDFSSGLGRITTRGAVTEYHVRHTCETTPWNIAAAPDGSLWLGELNGSAALVRFDPALAP